MKKVCPIWGACPPNLGNSSKFEEVRGKYVGMLHGENRYAEFGEVYVFISYN